MQYTNSQLIAVLKAARRLLSFLLTTTAVIMLQLGCLGGTIRNDPGINAAYLSSIGSFDDAIGSLDSQVLDLQSVLQHLNSQIPGDIQSILRVEITNLMQECISANSAEFRCNVEFLRIRVEQELRRLRNSLAEEINNIGLLAPIPLLEALPLEPYISNIIPSVIDLNLDLDRQTHLDIYGFDFRSLPVTAEIVGFTERRNVTTALCILSDYHMVLDLSKNGADLIPDSRRIVLGWNGVSQSVIPIISSESDYYYSVDTVTLPADTLMLIPQHIQGNRDFSSHGPWVDFSLVLSVDAEGRNICAQYTMNAYESRDDQLVPIGDFTAVMSSESTELYRVASPSERILGIDHNGSVVFHYVDVDHQDDVFEFSENMPIEKLVFVGDTKGEEAGLVTGVTIYLRETQVVIERSNPQ